MKTLTPEEILLKLVTDGGSIVCSGQCSTAEITEAQASDRFTIVDGFGFVLRLPKGSNPLPKQPSKLSPEIPRRSMWPEWTEAEVAIANAVEEVEEAGAHPLLTDAVILLGEAKDKVADYVELDWRKAL